MSKDGYPSVYMVDTCTTLPPVPPRLSHRRQRAGVAQTLLIMLVSVALCGMAIEAFFIYRLYHPGSDNSLSSSKLTGGQVVSTTKSTKLQNKAPRLQVLPSKPVAHLTDGQDVLHENHIMAWSMDANPLLHKMSYKDKSLIIQKEGYYHIYSKVSFLDVDMFKHYVCQKTKRYPGESIPLLMSLQSSERPRKMRSNSFLAGVFHLRKDDAILVEESERFGMKSDKCIFSRINDAVCKEKVGP